MKRNKPTEALDEEEKPEVTGQASEVTGQAPEVIIPEYGVSLEEISRRGRAGR